jgi:hypothetical protein
VEGYTVAWPYAMIDHHHLDRARKMNRGFEQGSYGFLGREISLSEENPRRAIFVVERLQSGGRGVTLAPSDRKRRVVSKPMPPLAPGQWIGMGQYGRIVMIVAGRRRKG